MPITTPTTLAFGFKPEDDAAKQLQKDSKGYFFKLGNPLQGEPIVLFRCFPVKNADDRVIRFQGRAEFKSNAEAKRAEQVVFKYLGLQCYR